jgi:hypothetical protein
MDQTATIKTPNPECRLYWCLIEFIDLDSQVVLRKHYLSQLFFDLLLFYIYLDPDPDAKTSFFKLSDNSIPG